MNPGGLLDWQTSVVALIVLSAAAYVARRAVSRLRSLFAGRRHGHVTILDLKPHGGLTHVIDKGLGPRAWEDVLETSGEYIDVVKLGWGTAYVTPNLRKKLADDPANPRYVETVRGVGYRFVRR